MQRLAVLAVPVLVLAGCGGIGIPKQQSGETYAGERHQVAGTIEIDDYGCIKVRLDDGGSYAAIWPASTNQGNEDYVNLAWFQRDLGDGDRVEGTAALTPVADLKDWGSSSYWSNAIGHCAATGDQAIVFDEAHGVDP